MKNIFFIAFFSFLLCGNALAEITTKKQAVQFIDHYCISLVNEFKQTLEEQNELIKDVEEAGEEDIGFLLLTGVATSGRIDRFVEIYSKLCK